jgi:hypothetical protein
MELEIITNYDISVITLLRDQGRNSHIHVVLEEINGEIYFQDGQVHFTKFYVKMGNISLQFKSIIFKTIYKMFSGLITNKINDQINKIQGNIEKAINEFINAPFIVDVGYGVGMNLTNTERPELFLYDKPTITESRVLVQSQDFLGARNYKLVDNRGAVIIFGIKGTVYPNKLPDQGPVFPSPPPMTFLDHLFDNKINVLLSAYTLNHVFFYIGQLGIISAAYRTEDGTQNPWNKTLDTDGLTEFIPELNGKFDEPKKLELRFVVNAKNSKPLIDIKSSGNTIDMNFSVELNIETSNDDFDFPETYLQLNVTSVSTFLITAIDDNISIQIKSNKIRDIDATIDKIGITKESITPFLSNYVNMMMVNFQTLVTNIKVVETLSNLTGIKFKELYFSTDNGYFDFSIDI